MKYINESPKLRLLLTLALTILIGVFSSLFATEIAPEGILIWSLYSQAFSFWVLITLSIIWLYLHVNFMRNDSDILRFADDEYCKAHIRKTDLEAYSALSKRTPESLNSVDISVLREKIEGNS